LDLKASVVSTIVAQSIDEVTDGMQQLHDQDSNQFDKAMVPLDEFWQTCNEDELGETLEWIAKRLENNM